MEQIEIPLFRRVNGPDVVPPSYLRMVKTYREVVRLCWTARKAKGMKPVDLAQKFDFIRQHVNDYLNEDDAPGRRNLPPERIADFEEVCGNCAITQWLAMRAELTVMEEMQAMKACA